MEGKYIFQFEDLKYNIFDDHIVDMEESCRNITINKRIGILNRCFEHLRMDLFYLQSIKKLRECVHAYDMNEEDLRRIISYI